MSYSITMEFVTNCNKSQLSAHFLEAYNHVVCSPSIESRIQFIGFDIDITSRKEAVAKGYKLKQVIIKTLDFEDWYDGDSWIIKFFVREAMEPRSKARIVCQDRGCFGNIWGWDITKDINGSIKTVKIEYKLEVKDDDNVKF